jgi:class 3 adenylate cyclase
MAAEIKTEIELEIAHVLFLDIVGYSKLSVNEQHARVDELNQIVRGSEQFQKAEGANRILKIPTGDGMALVFYRSPEEPAQCAFEIGRALKNNQRLHVRMGIHSGPVSGVVDVNERTNVAGAGINLAQRVMDCGDAGHIPGLPSCGRGSGGIRTMATVSARHRHFRGETRCAGERDQPLLR